MSGASGSGDDMVVGFRNESGDSTSLIAINEDGDVYGADYVLNVSTSLLAIKGIDAIHAEGKHGGHGVISKGFNGVVGYVDTVARDGSLEDSVGAGLLGAGGGASPGVFGSGQNGIVGYEKATPRDVAFEGTQKAGVLGRGETGVSGDGTTGPGVFGRGETGVSGDGRNGPGVFGSGLPGVHGTSNGGAGVLGEGDTGVIASATRGSGPGIIAQSRIEQAAVLESVDVAQLKLVPLRIKDPTSLRKSDAGELLATIWPSSDQKDAIDVASLWFCTDARPGMPPNWVKLA